MKIFLPDLYAIGFWRYRYRPFGYIIVSLRLLVESGGEIAADKFNATSVAEAT